VGKHIITVQDGRDDLPLDDSGVLVLQIVGCLYERLADEELVERDQVLLVVVNCGVFLHLYFLLFFRLDLTPE
jgi:hypothetical protein